MKYIVAIIVLIIISIIYIKSTQQEANKIYKLNETGNHKFKDDVITLFKKFMEKGISSNSVKIEFNKEYYIQYLPIGDIKEIYCEAVSNNLLTENYKISSQNNSKLIDLKFTSPNSKDEKQNVSQNFSKLYKINSEDDYNSVYNEMIYIMETIYGYNRETNISIKIMKD